MGTAHIHQMKDMVLVRYSYFSTGCKKESSQTPLNVSTLPFLGAHSIISSNQVITVWCPRANSKDLECSAPTELTSPSKDHKALIKQATCF